jgi:TolB-like protein/DNA-binding winged helix-turn-helix (wHTH) protein/Tfp pilus assembly protein PilF
MPANVSTSSAIHRTYSFGEFTLDLDRGALLRAGADIKLRPKSFEVLSYLIERQGLLVTKDELFNAIWGRTVVTEDAITQCMSDIRRALRDQSQETIRTVPRRGYIFDLPVKKQGGSVMASDASPRSKFALSWPRRRLAAALILMLGVAAVWWGFGNRGVEVPVTVEPRSTVAPHSIAVLPFINMSPDSEQEYFSDGISEEILNLLAKVRELRVTSRFSAFSFKGQNVDIPTIAAKLNVAYVLDGSVRKSGNELRVTAQLIDVATDTHLWSQTYDRELENVFAIQDDIAASVVEQLKVTLLGEAPHVEEADPEAYALALQARYLGRQGTAEGLEQSIALFQQALAIDPNYAAAWAGLAIFYENQVLAGLRSVDEGSSLARDANEKALAIDPDYALAHANLGYNAMVYDSDLVAAARHLERALALEQANPIILGDAGRLMRYLGRLEQAIALHEYAIGRDPVIRARHATLGDSYLVAGRWDEAIASYQTALRLSPGVIGGHYWPGLALLYKGEAQAALAEFEQEIEEGLRVMGQALALHALDRQEASQAKLKEFIARWGDQYPSEVWQVYAYIGDADNAFQWLDRAIEKNEPTFDSQYLLPFYEPIHGDPRWAAYLERVGRLPEQLDAIEFEVALPK